MRSIHYDFGPINEIFARMIVNTKADMSDLNNLKKELNKFFCRDTDPIAKKNIKITLVEIGFDGNYYFDKKTGRKF